MTSIGRSVKGKVTNIQGFESDILIRVKRSIWVCPQYIYFILQRRTLLSIAEYEYILVERDERVGIVMLNRPKELNALSFSLVGELADALEAFDRDESIGCIVLTGSGEKAFAAGADIKEMADKTPIDMLNGGFSAWQRIKRIQKPLIAAVNGFAL